MHELVFLSIYGSIIGKADPTDYKKIAIVVSFPFSLHPYLTSYIHYFFQRKNSPLFPFSLYIKYNNVFEL